MAQPITDPTDSAEANAERPRRTERSDNGGSPWLSNFGWMLGSAYFVGLGCRRGYEAWWGYPPVGDDTLLDANYAVFGGLMLLFSVLANLTALAMFERKPVREADQWWDKIGAPNFRRMWGREAGLFGRSVSKSIRWFLTVLTYVLPYFLSVAILAAMASGGINEETMWIAGLVSFAPLAWWLLLHLEMTGRTAEERDLISQHSALLFSIEPVQQRSFRITFFLAFGSLLFGVNLYPRVVAGLGGGKLVPVSFSWSEKADTARIAALRGLSGRRVFFAGRHGDYLIFQRSAEPRSAAVAIQRDLVASMGPPLPEQQKPAPGPVVPDATDKPRNGR